MKTLLYKIVICAAVTTALISTRAAQGMANYQPTFALQYHREKIQNYAFIQGGKPFIARQPQPAKISPALAQSLALIASLELEETPSVPQSNDDPIKDKTK